MPTTFDSALKKIAEKDPSLTELIIEDKNLDDKMLPLLRPELLKNPHIDTLYIIMHCLTEKSYGELLDLVKSNTHLIAFGVQFVMTPLGCGDPSFSGAIQRILKTHQEQKRQAEILTAFNSTKETTKKNVLQQDVPTDRLISNGPTTRNGRH